MPTNKNKLQRNILSNFTPLHISPSVPFYFHFVLSQSRTSIYPPEGNNNNSDIARLSQHTRAHVYAQEQKHTIHTSSYFYLTIYKCILVSIIVAFLSVYLFTSFTVHIGTYSIYYVGGLGCSMLPLRVTLPTHFGTRACNIVENTMNIIMMMTKVL